MSHDNPAKSSEPRWGDSEDRRREAAASGDNLAASLAVKLAKAASLLTECVEGTVGDCTDWNRRVREFLQTALPESGAPIGYAVRMADGPFVGIWQDRAEAERVCAKQPPGHGDKVVPVYAAPVSAIGQRTELTGGGSASLNGWPGNRGTAPQGVQECRENSGAADGGERPAPLSTSGTIPSGMALVCATCRFYPTEDHVKACSSGDACPHKWGGVIRSATGRGTDG